jgi:hypothetical protein
LAMYLLLSGIVEIVLRIVMELINGLWYIEYLPSIIKIGPLYDMFLCRTKSG